MSEQLESSTDNHISVLLVDDSSIIRRALTNIIEQDTLIKVVKSVSDGQLGISAAAAVKPDIVVLDIEMPNMDGITALPKILEASPKSKVIMFSTLTEKGADISLKALSLGAVECIAKPTTAADVGANSLFNQQIIGIIKGLVPHKTLATQIAPTAQPPAQLTTTPSTFRGKPSIIAIGSSTGGPQALFEVISHFEGFDVPIIVTQHMPAHFTKMLATHIQTHTGISAHEASEAMPVENGNVYVAPGGHHLKIVKNDDQLVCKIDDGPPENFCKPSVDPMFRSVIDLYGPSVLGIILTGMGNDGLPSSQQLVEKGGRLIAQNEETCVVWGMPRAVAEAGICTEILPLENIGPWVKQTMGI